MDTTGSYIRQKRIERGWSLQQLAERAGLKKAHLDKLERGANRMTVDYAVSLLTALGANPADVLRERVLETGEASDRGHDILLRHADGTQTAVEVKQYRRQVEIRGRPYIAIPVYDVRASAGFGSVNEEMEPASTMYLEPTYLRSLVTAPVDGLVVIRVSGDSMEPTYRDGDQVFVDTAVRRVEGGDVYVIRPTGTDEIMLKRCSRNVKSGLIRVSSDNSAYPEDDGLNDGDLHVIGRVVRRA